MGYHLMAQDVLRLMNELNEEKATLIGHSMGGKAFMTMALEHVSNVCVYTLYLSSERFVF